MKMLITTTTSFHCPALCDKAAIPRDSAPAETVPSARLNPLLSVAPTYTKARVNIEQTITKASH